MILVFDLPGQNVQFILAILQMKDNKSYVARNYADEKHTLKSAVNPPAEAILAWKEQNLDYITSYQLQMMVNMAAALTMGIKRNINKSVK